MDARSKVQQALSELEDAAYQRGIQDERKRLEPVIQKLRNMLAELEFEPQFKLGDPSDLLGPQPPQPTLPHNTRVLRYRSATYHPRHLADPADPPQPPRAGSDQDRVLQDIKDNPGSRGVDIVNRLHNQVEERTVRTALHRLHHTKNLITNIDGVWFTTEQARQMQTGQPG